VNRITSYRHCGIFGKNFQKGELWQEIQRRRYTLLYIPAGIIYYVNSAKNSSAGIIDYVNYAKNPPAGIIDYVNYAKNPPAGIIDYVNYAQNPPAGIIDYVNDTLFNNLFI
jgi:phage terminase large subunit-like protein